MKLKLKSSSSNIFILLLILIITRLEIYNGQIYDNFTYKILEEDSEIIDVNDYLGYKLLVTTKKNIYRGVPPELIMKTEANLINSSVVMTINYDYILVACLQDSLLSKINVKNGNFSSLLNYSDIAIDEFKLEKPTKSCSLSIIENQIYIGYTKINNYNESHINRTNVLIRINITNLNSSEGPDINKNASRKYFIFPKTETNTRATKHIACEPIRIKSDLYNFRIICIEESLEYAEDYNMYRYYLYARSINKVLETIESSYLLYRANYDSGFKIYKTSETTLRILMKKGIFDLSIGKDSNNNVDINTSYTGTFPAYLDLFDYNNKIIFHSEQANFANNYIYYFKIIKEGSSNYFILYDYQETNITKILCFYDKSKDSILFLYQTLTKIKYFSMFIFSKIFEVKAEKSKILKVKSNFERYYNVNEFVNVSSIGNLNVLKILRYKNEVNYKNETFGYDFTELIMSDNNIFIEKTYNEWYDYYLTFIEQVENNYTRIYYLDDILFKLRTCYPTQCESCREDYGKCDDCKYEGYALIRNTNKTCYLIDKLIKGYIYNETGKIFEKCYSSCDFCYSNSSDKTTHKCLSCSNGYFPSYKIIGNCYLEDDETFIKNSCSKYKIHSTGECVEECPTSISYCSFIYNQALDNYEKFDISPPKYLFNNQCYESCPLYSKPDGTNICKCEFAFFVENGEITCFEDDNCLSNYPYQNPDTKECFFSLDDCFSKGNNFFFNKECYKNGCPNDKIPLNDINEEQKEYFKNKILLDDNLEDKLCICNINDGFWSNIENNSENELYFQKCLTECSIGYESENLTNLCIKKNNTQTTLIIIFLKIKVLN